MPWGAFEQVETYAARRDHREALLARARHLDRIFRNVGREAVAFQAALDVERRRVIGRRARAMRHRREMALDFHRIGHRGSAQHRLLRGQLAGDGRPCSPADECRVGRNSRRRRRGGGAQGRDAKGRKKEPHRQTHESPSDARRCSATTQKTCRAGGYAGCGFRSCKKTELPSVSAKPAIRQFASCSSSAMRTPRAFNVATAASKSATAKRMPLLG